MSLQEEIKKAIGAHGLWKARLVAAIETGKSEFVPEKVCTDNQCDFGKWLYGVTITSADKTGSHYESVRKLHAEFHKIAAKILELALAGKKDEAKKMMDPGSEFASLSSKLTVAMTQWAGSVK